MTQIVLTPNQVKVVLGSTGHVEIFDPQGKLLGYLTSGVSSKDLAIARQRLASGEPGFTFDEVMTRLHSLEAK